jgi:hypothetical protein
MRAHAKPTTSMPEIVTKTRSIDLGCSPPRSSRSVWNGFRPDMSEGAWQHSIVRVRRHLNPLFPKQFLVHARDHALRAVHPDDER